MDDTTVTETIGPDSNSNLQDLVNYIDYWTTSNNMKLNVGKCKELVIDFARKKYCFLPLTVDKVTIDRVKSARILNLTVQDNMKWNQHIYDIVKKASKRLYMSQLLIYDLRPICRYHNYVCRIERFKNSFLPQTILNIN